MLELGFYERAVPIRSRGKNTARRITVAVLAGIALVVWIISAIISGAGAVACVLVSVLIAAVPFVVSGFSATELEYSISADSVSLAMIYGKSRRKEVFFAEADDILLIAPNTKENRDYAASHSPRESFSALSEAKDGLSQWLILFKDEKENNYIFTFEAEDGIVKLLKALRPSALRLR